ncbi:insulinase (Peptidase family m16) domain-containing protein [Ditylenchus destructor]|uniref:Insulinase (Peptidase family m16) domain-containing protein n=1 Tax=Ditylenchus destructor TaxID=166010 RepID=A0AAD4MX88_9BILA|nr:insulinase (Peptidase family m16) domain-containing protein [Ditylenchus destructor]
MIDIFRRFETVINVMLARKALRGFASVPLRVPQFPPALHAEEYVSLLPNNLTVASVDLNGTLSHFVLAIRAGSRYEQPDERGVVHALRNYIGTDSPQQMGMKLRTMAYHIGADLTATISKDLLTIRMSVPRAKTHVALSLLGEFSQPTLPDFDLESVKRSLVHDIAHQNPFDVMVELLHEVAYRGDPLSNPILATRDSIPRLKHSSLGAFVKSRFTASDSILVGVNTDHEVLLNYAAYQKIGNMASKPMNPSKYHGGAVRARGPTNNAHVAVAGEGARLTDVSSVAVQSVLSYIIGQGPILKYDNDSGMGVVARAVLKAANHNLVGVNSLNIVHSDSGLAGVYIVAPGDYVTPYVKVALAALKDLANAGPDVDVLETAKKRAEVETYRKSECPMSLADDRAAQFLAAGNAISPMEFVMAIHEVTSEDIMKACAKIVSRPSVAAFGKVDHIAHIPLE